MKNEQLYNKTVDILVQAYLNDTLQHGNCYACAVGNMVAANKSYTYYEGMWVDAFSWWNSVFSTDVYYGIQTIEINNYTGDAKEQIDSTGYSVRELAEIELSFETAPRGNSDDEWMFNGLMAVIGVLDKIHENTDTELTNNTKLRFASSTQS